MKACLEQHSSKTMRDHADGLDELYKMLCYADDTKRSRIPLRGLVQRGAQPSFSSSTFSSPSSIVAAAAIPFHVRL